MKKYLSLLLTSMIIISCGESTINEETNAQNYPQMIKVTGGTFIMGDEYGIGYSNEQPLHRVTLSDYYIGKTEVTAAQYRFYCRETGVNMPEEPHWGWNDNAPIVNVNWDDAINYCDWLSNELDKNITLPTEAQWEFVARGGNQSRGYIYSGGNDADAVAWYSGNGDSETHRVAQKKANELGLYDMSGNVCEWCLDWYDWNYYSKSPNRNPKNTRRVTYNGSYFRVLRGGGYRYRYGGEYDAFNCRVANREISEPVSRFNKSGFRVVSF